MISQHRVMFGVLFTLILVTPVANAAPIVFDGLVAIYRFGESSTTTNPGGKSVEDQFGPGPETKSPEDLGLNQSQANPAFTGMLGHNQTDDSLTLMSRRAVNLGTLANNPDLSTFESGGAFILVGALFHVVGGRGTLFDVFEQDLLTGVLRTTIDSGIAESRSIAEVHFTTFKTDRRYLQTASLRGDAFAVDRQIVRDLPGPRKVTDVGQSTPEFMFDQPSSVQSRINFDSGFQFLTRVAGEQQFTVLGVLETSVAAQERNASASSNFFDTAVIKLKAQAIPEPSTLTLLGIGTFIMAGWGWRLRKRPDG